MTAAERAVRRSSAAEPRPDSSWRSGPFLALSLSALGIVYGDLVTSPLYSIREAYVNPRNQLQVNRVNVLGGMSIVIWTLLVLVAVKYVLLVMRADNQGEGGILALAALVPEPRKRSRVAAYGAGLLAIGGLFGAALLYGDGIITPSISVLSAVEGLSVVNSGLRSAVVPIAVGVLVVLFWIQHYGTAVVGRLFGPVLLLWVLVMGVISIHSLIRTPDGLSAIDPMYAVRFFQANRSKALLAMGTLFLVCTGVEALYADMGQVGRRPITFVWYVAVMPILFATYLGIGAGLLRHPENIESPFFLMAPGSLRLPIVILATFATIIASQSLISGVFSVTHQASNLGYLPRTRVRNTSSSIRGQVYLPLVNWVLAICCIALVLAFRTSNSLAAAMGLSVTGTMLTTTVLLGFVARRVWGWSRLVVWPLLGLIGAIEMVFFVANVFKIPHGGWVTLAAASVVFLLMTTWRRGVSLASAAVHSPGLAIADLASLLERETDPVTRVPGTAVFLGARRGRVPRSLIVELRSARSARESIYVVTAVTEDVPIVVPARRVEAVQHGAGVSEVLLRYGFTEETRIADDLQLHLDVRPETTYYYLDRRTILSTGQRSADGMRVWRERLFAFMVRNSLDAVGYLGLPPERVVEVGAAVQL